MNINITPSNIGGCVDSPPSKSYAHRMLICAALTGGKSIVHGISESEDMYATLDCIKALGIKYKKDGDTVYFEGTTDCEPEYVFRCRESGSTLRFFIPIGQVFNGENYFSGSKRLMERGIGVYKDAFAEKNIMIDDDSDGVVVTGLLKSGEYCIPGNISSQYATGLLTALPLLDGDSRLIVSEPIESYSYIGITLDVLKQFGIVIKEEKRGTYYIRGNQKYVPGEYTVEGDWSNSAALLAYNAVGGNVKVCGLNDKSCQGDMICLEMIEKLKKEFSQVDISDCPDLGPILFAVAAVCHGGKIKGIGRLRIKECDRVKAMICELAKVGISCEESEDEVVIHHSVVTSPGGVIESWNDHRIVMAMTLVLSICGGTIRNYEAVGKSFPDYFKVMKSLGLEVVDCD